MVSTTPNDVAQNRKTTLAADTIPGSSAGRVTVRSTRQGLAPRAAAASSRRRSIASQNAPTVRTTTLMLKNTSAATIAIRRAVEAERPQRAGGRDQLPEGHADDHRRQHEGHDHQRPQEVTTGEPQPVEGERDRHARPPARSPSRSPPTTA